MRAGCSAHLVRLPRSPGAIAELELSKFQQAKPPRVTRDQQAKPMGVARVQVARVTRFRRFGRLISPLLRRSERLRRVLARHLAGSSAYTFGNTAVSIHDEGKLWTVGQLRLLLITHDLSLSGAPRVVEQIAQIFSEDGWFVTVVSPVDGPARESITPYAAVVIDETVLREDSPMLALLAPVSDLALANTVVSVGAVIALAKQTDVFWYLHEVSLLTEMQMFDERVPRALDLAKRVFSGSDLSASIVRARRPDVCVLPYGVSPLPLVSPKDSRGPTDLIKIAVFGSIEPRKGQDLAVAALIALPKSVRSSMKLTLYGKVLDKAFSNDLGLVIDETAEVVWGGELAPAAYVTAMIMTDIVLVSSRDDTLPLVSLDALGAKKILICTRTTGTSTWIRDGVNGFIAETADVDALTDALGRALARRSDWLSIGEAGRAVFDSAFSEKAFATKLLLEAWAAIYD